MTTAAPPLARPSPIQKPKPTFGDISGERVGVAIILAAVEGWGKTSVGAYAESPAIIMAGNEKGYRTLLQASRVPKVPAKSVLTWTDLMDLVAGTNENPGNIRTVFLDSLGTAERLCHEHVCRVEFKGEWGEKGFGSFQKGYDTSIPEWLKLLAALDKLREGHGIDVIIAAHTRIKTFKNPEGADYDRFTADCHDKTWGATARWADACLFGKYLTVIDNEKKGKGKAIGGTERLIYTERRDTWDAKNRYGMPECIEVANDHTKTYETIFSHIRKAEV